MVGKDSFLYLLIGQDSFSKEIKFKKIKEENLTRQIEDFNLDVLYARETNLKSFQEKILLIPLKSKKRIIVVKNAQYLKEDIKEFIFHLAQDRRPKSHIILVLDFDRQDPKDEFFRKIMRFAQVYRFSSPIPADTFTLSRQIDLRKADSALRILNQLFRNGEKPERIIGGLRYACEKDSVNSWEKRKKLQLLLNCDIEIKRGRLLPEFALEKLVVNLCNLKKP
jgi:DNA polymerase III delta subunit